MNFEEMKRQEAKARKERVKREKELAAREKRYQSLTEKSTMLQWEEKQYNENPNDPSAAYRLATARLCADIDAKARTEPANEEWRQQGLDTAEVVKAELSKKSWRRPYNISAISRAIVKLIEKNDSIKNKIGFKAVWPIVNTHLKGNDNS